MANNKATEFLKKVLSDETLKARMADPSQAVALAAELGYEVTEDELLASEQELRKGSGEGGVTELDEADMDRAAGGAYWYGDDAPDGHELGCDLFYHDYEYSKDNGVWCTKEYYIDNDTPCGKMNIMTHNAICRTYNFEIY